MPSAGLANFMGMAIIASIAVLTIAACIWLGGRLWRKKHPVTVKENAELAQNIKGKYLAYVWRRDNKKIEPEMVEVPIGAVHSASPPLPKVGATFFLKESKDGKELQAHRCLEQTILENGTPEDLAEAINWDREWGDALATPWNAWDAVKLLAPYLIAAGLLLLNIIIIG